MVFIYTAFGIITSNHTVVDWGRTNFIIRSLVGIQMIVMKHWIPKMTYLNTEHLGQQMVEKEHWV